MNHIGTVQKIKQWLDSSTLPLHVTLAQAGNHFSCIIQHEDRDCILMLPENQTTLYLIAALYRPNLELDSDLITYCLCLNSHALGILKTAAIGLDTDNEQIILRNAYTLSTESVYECDNWLVQFLDQAEYIKTEINSYRQSSDSQFEDVESWNRQYGRTHRQYLDLESR